jgi:hypothetical protein
MIDDNVDATAVVKKTKADLGKKMGHAKTTTEKAKTSHGK